MHFKENADVLTAGGQKIGRIDRVVIDPGTDKVTHFVIKKGLLFTRDKVIPVDQAASTSEDQVRLKKDAANPDEFPDFEETHYIAVGGIEDFKQRESEKAKRLIWYYTRINVPWWGEHPYPLYPKPLFVKKTQRNIPQGTVPVEEGAKVVDMEGTPVGEIEDIFADPSENRITHLLVSQGTFAKEKKLIPSTWLSDISEDSVRLSLGKKIIDNLPEA